MSDKATTALRFLKFIVGAVFFAVMIYVHVYVKELSYFLFAFPGVLMGVDPVKVFNDFVRARK